MYSESFLSCSSSPLKTPGGIVPIPSFAIFAISSAESPVSINVGAPAPPWKLSP